MQEFEGRVAVVTGAASGMGRAFAERFAEAGMKVVLTDVERPALDATVTELRQRELDVLGVVANVAERSEVEALARQALDHFGAVHVLCNNAGVAGDLDFLGRRNTPLWEQSPSLWDWTFGVNVRGVLNGIRTFLPVMLEQDQPGHVVNTASMAGLLGGSGAGIYGATKHAVVRISEALYFQLRERDSKVGASVLCPGIINTRIFSSGRNRPADLWAGDDRPDAAEVAARIEAGDAYFAHGRPPRQVADQLFEAIRNEQFWVLTPDVPLDRIRTRTDQIVAGTNPEPPPPRPRP
jgi:NAD(P)-dependent dehydrogenase (short-subunit alcohol dehydrogenase family)